MAKADAKRASAASSPLSGDKQIKRNAAQAGDTVALARLEPF